LKVTVVAASTDAKRVGPWLTRIAPAKARGQVTLAIVSDAAMKALNKRFRGANSVTDVLSFPSGNREKRRGKPGPDLGDIVIARGMAARQARTLGHSFRTELQILALHGLLHLLGYDHDADSGRMARAEARLRRRAGLPIGLIARAS